MDQAKGGTADTGIGMAVQSIPLTTSKDPRYCSVCGKNMVNPITGAAFIGMSLVFSVDNDAANCDSDLAFLKKQLGIYGGGLEKDSPLLIDLCWECWFKSLGILPKE